MASLLMQFRPRNAYLRRVRFPRTGNLAAAPIADNTSTKSRSVHSSSVHNSSPPYHNLPATTTLDSTLAVFPRAGFPAEKVDTNGTLAGARPTRHTPQTYACRLRRSGLCSTVVVERASSATSRTGRDRTHPLQLWTQSVSGIAGPVPCVARLSSRTFSSSSDDTSPKKPEAETDEEEGEKKDVGLPSDAEAGFIEPEDLKHEEPRHVHIEMPAITNDEKVGTLTSWKIQVGDAIEAGDVVCEIELEQFSVGVKVDTTGFLAEILVEAGTENVPVGESIGTVVKSEGEIALYLEAQEPRAPARRENDASSTAETFSWKDVLKATLRLRQEEKFSEDSASTLMSLARKKDSDLLQAFEGCFEGDEYNGDIDEELFVMQARDIAKTRRKEASKTASASATQDQETEPQK